MVAIDTQETDTREAADMGTSERHLRGGAAHSGEAGVSDMAGAPNMSDDKTHTEAEGAFVTIDHAKLGLQGREMLGGVKVLQKWVAMLTSMRNASEDVQERAFLAEIIRALEDDGKRGLRALTEFAMKRGAAQLIEESQTLETTGKPS